MTVGIFLLLSVSPPHGSRQLLMISIHCARPGWASLSDHLQVALAMPGWMSVRHSR